MCQGVEIVLKALLLLRDFDKYQPTLKDTYGHDLVKLASHAAAEYQLHPLRDPVLNELKELNRLYSQHMLRYGFLLHTFVDPASIHHTHVMRRVAAMVRLASRETKRAFPAT